MGRNGIQTTSIDDKINITNIPFSTCWRIFVKLKYKLFILNHSVIKFLNYFFCVLGIIFVMLILSLLKEDHEIIQNRIPLETVHQKSNRRVFESLPQVYQVIESWSYNDSDNSSKFPILSSTGGNQRPRYTRNELFQWNDIPADNINDVLENLDKEEHNGSVSDFGEFGKAVTLPPDLIKQSKAKMSLHQLDVVASDIMSLNRKLNDMRNSRLLFNF